MINLPLKSGVQQTTFPFHIITKPTGPLCNLHCDYCFYLTKEEMFPGEGGKDFVMSDETLEAFTKGYIEAQPDGVAEINFAWQGGEPTLLGNDFYQKALDYQKKYGRAGMNISNSIQTNGTLIDDDRAMFFKDNDFLIGISIDGPEELHNKYRKDRNRKGSFHLVMKGLETLQRYNVDFNTLTVVQDDNSGHPEAVYDFLKGIGSEYLQFIPIVEPVYRSESPAGVDVPGPGSVPGPSIKPGKFSSRSVSSEGWGNFMTRIFRRWAARDIGKIYVQHFDMILGRYMGMPSSLCVHAETCGNAMAIEHNGALYSCDHFVFPENYLGNVLQNSVTDMASGEIQTRFGENKRDGLPDECRKCIYLPLCRGGCPKDRIIKRPTGNLNMLCGGYYELFEYTRPYMEAMAEALKNRMPADRFRDFLPPAAAFKPERNDPCPCLSGKKYKHCCG
ncbi:MAG: anaerobic sulfatase maturase [Spirochaetales bacterium]|nr:anaerobic sulfatase maturase [Spirochaetales bacterium]